jgi:hypothetical protein
VAALDQTHSASSAALGYLFQCRYALLAGLRAVPDSPQLEISIEKFDDVAFETAGWPTELIQTKHHIGAKGNLTDTSSDLWKTLLIWAKLAAKDVDTPFRVRFVLLTTGSAPDGSGASFLRMRARDETKADKLLLAAIAKSTNQANSEAYAAYKALPDSLRLSLLKAIFILDGSTNIIDVRDEIVRELYHAAPRDQIEHLVERLEGWWFTVVINALAERVPTAIPVLAIDQRVDELREEFKRRALPVDVRTSVPTSDVIAELDKRPFVRQLRKIKIGPPRIEYAIRDYYRASEQRSRWAREELLLNGELEAYEQGLIEAWEPRHAAMLDGVTEACAPERKVALGQELFRWAEQEANFPLRSIRDRFLTHGSYHILSNRYALGWHPDFKLDEQPGGGG